MDENENKPVPLDITVQIKNILDDHENTLPKFARIDDLMKSTKIKSAPAVSVVLPWKSVEQAKWAKAWLEGGVGKKPTRQVAIVCTRAEMGSAANVFASGVEWINSESEDLSSH